MMDAKVNDYPDLVKRGTGGVVNTNHAEYHRALSRQKNSKRIENLEGQVQDLHSKLDQLLALLTVQK